MDSKISLGDRVDFTLEGNPSMLDAIKRLKGRFRIEHTDRDGNLIGEYEMDNGITTGGKNSLLNTFFNNTTPPVTWYFGVVDNSGFSAFTDATDTMSSHSGWNEFTNVSGNRVAWGNGSASSASITNGTAATISITGSGTLKGIFVTTVNTVGGTTGVLWSTAAFSSTVNVNNGDNLKITYTVNC